eukprot:COSAG01_NODE_4451_length_5007_cov_5.064181_8_plen_138_part_00
MLTTCSRQLASCPRALSCWVAVVTGAGGNALRNISHSLWAGWALQANALGFSNRPFDGGAPARHDFLSPRTNAALTMLDGLAGKGSGGDGGGAAPPPAAATQQPASLEGGCGGLPTPGLPENAYVRQAFPFFAVHSG